MRTSVFAAAALGAGAVAASALKPRADLPAVAVKGNGMSFHVFSILQPLF